MKKILLPFVIFALFPLRADDFIPNGDFSQGTTGWSGNFQVANAAPDGGIALQLKPHEWTTLTQNIAPYPHLLHFMMVYSISIDAKLSSNTKEIGVSGANLGLKSIPYIDSRPDFADVYLEGDTLSKSSAIPFKLTTGSPDRQTMHNLLADDGTNKNTLTIAFPPGTGTATIYHVSAVPPLHDTPIAPTEPPKLENGIELLKNVDFSDGTAKWRGDLKQADAESSTDLTTGTTNGKGIAIELRSSNWTKVTQEIRNLKDMSKVPLRLAVEYAVSSDFSLSAGDRDYSGNEGDNGIGSQLGFSKAEIRGTKGQLLAIIDCPRTSFSELTPNGIVAIVNDNVSSQTFTPTDGGPKTFVTEITMPQMNQQDNPVLCIAIPPGHGIITFTKISLLGPRK